MEYFFLEPEVAGAIGPRTIIDTSVHPPLVSELNYEFSGWLGDALLESFPCFIISESAAGELEKGACTGMKLSDAEISRTAEFDSLYPGKVLPKFLWLQVQGLVGSDDFGIASDLRLVVSGKALEILQVAGINHAFTQRFHG